MIDYNIDKNQRTSHYQLLDSLVNQSKALKTIHNHKTWCLSALTYALHLNDCLILFEDLKKRWEQKLPFDEAWDVDFRKWKAEIWSAANDIQSEVNQEWKSLCDSDYNRFIELSQQVANGEITIRPLVEFVEGKESSILKIITDAGRKLSELFSDIESSTIHSDESLYDAFYDECIEAYVENNRENLHYVRVNKEFKTYEQWAASKTAKKRPASIEQLMEKIANEMNAYKTLEDVWSDCYDANTKEIDGEAIARNLFINRKDFITTPPMTCQEKMDRLFYTVTMLEFLKERYKELTLIPSMTIDSKQQEQQRKEVNSVFRTQINDHNINFGKFIRFLNEYGVTTITYKYEWMAIYLFAKEQNLLQEPSFTAFAEQMNKAGWFGHVAARRQCSADAMGDYSFLTMMERPLWENISIPGGSKASKNGVNHIIRKYDNLTLQYQENDIY